MALTTGTRLGSFEILAAIGAGGMGEVYRARDTSLKREVALKILPQSLSVDPGRLARFQREAEVLASLNHPNIAAIHGLAEAGSAKALVLELVDGEDLSERIARGPIPVDECLAIARQIAEALEAAHDQGIIHRDLKPANIKLRSDGAVKVLDFGLAKALDPYPAGAVEAGASPTVTSPAMTGVGVLLGTAAYMSPEQARGKPVDRRTDIWAFGCVFYEMLTGRRAFDGEDVSLTLAQILQRDPPLEALPDDVPARIRQAVHLCLRKSRKERLTDMGAARLMLEGAFETGTVQSTAHSPAPPSTSRRTLLFLLAVLAGAAVGGASVWRLTPTPVSESRRVVRFALPPSADFAPRGLGVGRHVLAISSQGTQLVYWGGKTLHLQALDRLDGDVALRGTESAREPFFSPDGRWIGFHQDGQLKRVPVGGGASIALAAARNPYGVSWDTDGVIRYGQGPDGIWQVSPSGGAPAQLIKVAASEAAHGPQLLPGGDWVLFTLRPANEGSWDQAQIVAQSLQSGERIVLIDRGRDARYLQSGHLVYGVAGVLLGAPFDVRSRRITGPAVPLVEGIMDADVRTGAMHFTVSDDGTLVYLSGSSSERSKLVWVHRSGRRETLPAEALTYSYFRLSPDATRIAVEVVGPDGLDIYLYDLARGAMTRLTSSPLQGRHPLWTPAGEQVVFYSDADGGGLYSIAAEGTGAPNRLTTSSTLQKPYSWADGGRTLLFEQRPSDQAASADIYSLSLDQGATATPLIRTAAADLEPALSPDGRWLAYSSADASAINVFVRPFPNVDGGRWQISTNGGHAPMWAPGGKELYFVSRGQAMSVAIEASPSFRASTPTVMFDLPSFYSSSGSMTARQWDIAPDGQRFLIVNPGEDGTGGQPPSRIVVVLNWREELKQLVPAK